MKKNTRAEKRAEEARIIAEMESAMRGEDCITAPTPSSASKPQKPQDQAGMYASKEKNAEKAEEKIYCKRCKSRMEKGVCPVCGYRVYTPMDEGKIKKIRLIVAGVCIVAFLALFLALRLT